MGDNTLFQVEANIPDMVSKELSIQRVGDNRRRIQLSTNFLPLFGFETGMRHTVEPMPGGGLRISFPTGDTSKHEQKVYGRTYSQRSNNPFETVIEIKNQGIINVAFPDDATRTRVVMRKGMIEMLPLLERATKIRKNMAGIRGELPAFVAMTSGMDARCLAEAGFRIREILEYRPQEARDGNDLTETGVLSCLANVGVQRVYNEDITKIDMRQFEFLEPVAVLHLSLQCDDFSNLKAKALKDASMADLSTSRDLVYDGLRLIESVAPAAVVVENVPGFAGSAEGMLLRTKLRRWGYFVEDAVLKAPEYGGRTGRTRYYMVASVYPGFKMPERDEKGTMEPLWNLVKRHLAECNEVTGSKALADGLACGRARLITPESVISPTVTKSQNRGAKDSIFIRDEAGRFFMPSNELLRELQGIPMSMSFDIVGKTIESEIIGQGIDFPMHGAVVTALHKHLRDNIGPHAAYYIGRDERIGTAKSVRIRQRGDGELGF